MNSVNALLEWAGSASFQLLVAAAIAWLLCITVARSSPSLKHAIWVIVLLKCFVPPATSAPWSLGHLIPAAIQPTSPNTTLEIKTVRDNEPTTLRQRNPQQIDTAATSSQPTPDQLDQSDSSAPAQFDAPTSTSIEAAAAATSRQPTSHRSAQTNPAIAAPLAKRPTTAYEAFRQWAGQWITAATLFSIWAAGATITLAIGAASVSRIASRIRKGRPVDEGPAAIALEEATLALGLKSPPRLIATNDSTTPFLAGLWQPTVVIPQSILDSLPADEIRLVVWHEVVHVARRDAWLSLLQLMSVAMFWFHPAVWFAAAAVRREREACCDETVLRTSHAPPSTYGDAFLHVLSAVRGRAIVAPAWAAPAGVFERDSDLRSRIEHIMSFRPQQSRRVQVVFVAALFALAVLPMGMSANDPWQNISEEKIPVVVSIVPATGSTNVDPQTSAIAVTFDRPMDSGFSWTGGGPTFPKSPTGTQPTWSNDGKTCSLPVELQEGTFYRLGVNSKRFHNFRSVDGVPAKPVVLTFTTQGANAAAVGRMDAPKIVAISPANGAADVHPLTTKEIWVTFDRPMGQGMSWVGDGEQFPPTLPGLKSYWLANSRTCVMPVDLARNHQYQLSFNSDRFKNFQSTSGVPLDPVKYSFQTVTESTAAVILNDSFEKPHRDENFVDYWGHNRTTDDAATGQYAVKLQKLDPPAKFPASADPDVDVTFVQNGTSYGWGDPFDIPQGTAELQVSVMVKAESVSAAKFKFGFMRYTPSAKAGKEKSYFTVPPVNADENDDEATEDLFIGRLLKNEPAASHGWAVYERTIPVPKLAELVNVSAQLEKGNALWIDDFVIRAKSKKALQQPNAQQPNMRKPAPLGGGSAGDETNDETRPPSKNRESLEGNVGLIFRDNLFDENFPNSFSQWQKHDAPGVVLRRRDDVGFDKSGDQSSLELKKTTDSYFPIASWSKQVHHNDPTATHVQLSAMVKTEAARKAVLDVLFLNENGEWIRHQWADYIGDHRNKWLADEGRLAAATKTADTDTAESSDGVTHDWHPYGGTVAIPKGTKSIEVSAQIYGPGTVWVDEIELRYQKANDKR